MLWTLSHLVRLKMPLLNGKVFCGKTSEKFFCSFLSSIFLDAALDISIVRKSGAPRFEPRAAG